MHFFLVYVSSLYFLLYKHTGAGGGGGLSYKGTRIFFFFFSIPKRYQFNYNKLYKGTDTTLAAVILGFSTLPIQKFKPPKDTTTGHDHFHRGVPPPPYPEAHFVFVYLFS